MRAPIVIAIWLVVILGMVVEANAMRGVHAEYMRRRWVQGQSSAVKIYPELPAGVHAEYRRRRQVERNPTAVAKIHHEVPAREHKRRPTPPIRRHTPPIRQHLRQRSGGRYV